MKTISKNCKECNNLFEASLKEHNRGNAKYCCKECTRAGVRKTNGRLYGNENKPKNVECATCKTPLYRSPSDLKLSKHGFYFCNRECKELAQSIYGSYGIAEMQLPHYGTFYDPTKPSANYRAKAIHFHGNACQSCGYDRVPSILQVHHINRDRENNHLENLKVLCPTCHFEDHYHTDSGWFAKKKDDGGAPR